MAQLQLAFTKKIDIKNQLVSAKINLKHILEDRPDFAKLTDERRIINNKVNQILQETADAYPKLIDEIEKLKVDLKEQEEMVSDCAVKDYLDKKDITIKDPNDDSIIWEPVIKIKYKRQKKSTLFDTK